MLTLKIKVRVGLSEPNSRKFRHNFSDTIGPMCPAKDGVEYTELYLLFANLMKSKI